MSSNTNLIQNLIRIETNSELKNRFNKLIKISADPQHKIYTELLINVVSDPYLSVEIKNAVFSYYEHKNMLSYLDLSIFEFKDLYGFTLLLLKDFKLEYDIDAILNNLQTEIIKFYKKIKPILLTEQLSFEVEKDSYFQIKTKDKKVELIFNNEYGALIYYILEEKLYGLKIQKENFIFNYYDFDLNKYKKSIFKDSFYLEILNQNIAIQFYNQQLNKYIFINNNWELQNQEEITEQLKNQILEEYNFAKLKVPKITVEKKQKLSFIQ